MKHKLQIIFSLLCIAALLFSGCTGAQKEPDITESLIWESAPALNFGTMTHEKLKVEPWYSGRCEATGNSDFAETELGYYFSLEGLLWYADKADLSLWVPVCNQPNCTHSMSWSYGQTKCNSHINSFLIKDGRIYFAGMASVLWNHYSMVTDTDGFCIASRALDGTDLRFEYKDDTMNSNEGGSFGYTLNQKYFQYSVSALNLDGSSTYRLYRLTDTGTTLISDHTAVVDIPSGYINAGYHFPKGEDTFYHYFLDENLDFLYRFVDGELVKYDFSGIEKDGYCYLSENQIRLYRQNDGYYDVDLATREEVRVGDAQLEDTYSFILLPNCIIETTLHYSAYQTVTEGEVHSLKLFDGEAWYDVQLPPELVNPGKNKYLVCQSITSDSIFFTYEDIMNIHHLYRIPLGTDTPVLEYCAELRLR